MYQEIRLRGFLVDCHCPTESNLDLEINASHLDWDEYQSLIIDLEDLLSKIDEEHSVRSRLVRGRSLRARYARISDETRSRRLRFSPFPSKYSNILSNTRSHVYSLLGQHCVVIEKVGRNNIYLLPKAIAPDFVEAIERLNTTVITPLREGIEQFRESKDYFTIQSCLKNHSVDPLTLKNTVFTVSNYLVDVTPVDFDYRVEGDQYYKKLTNREEMRGLEILKKQIERKHREYSTNAVKEITEKLSELAEGFDEYKQIRATFKKRWRQLSKICSALDLNHLVNQFINPTIKILDAPAKKRTEMMMDKFGTPSLTSASKQYLNQL